MQARRCPVDVVVQPRVGLARGHARPPDDHGDVAGRVVGGSVFTVDPQVALVLPVVRGNDDRGVLQDTGGLEAVQQPTHGVVDVADRGVVAVDPLLQRGAVGDPRRGAGEAVGVAVVVHPQVGRGVRAAALEVALQDIVGKPVGDRRVGERLAVVQRRAVVGVDVPEVEVQVPVVVGGVLVQPAVEHGLNGGDRFLAAVAGVVDFVEPGVELVGRVTLAEGRDHRGVIAQLLELPGEAVFFVGRAEVAVRALAFGVRRRPAVAHHAGVDPEPALVKRGPRGQAGRVGAVDVVQPRAARRHRVDPRRGVAVVAVAAQVRGVEGVEVEVEDAHRESLGERRAGRVKCKPVAGGGAVGGER